MTPYEETLARASEYGPASRSALYRPRSLRLDDGRLVKYPGPAVLADAYVAPLLADRFPGVEFLRLREGALAARTDPTAEPRPVTVPKVVTLLRDALAALPPREGASVLYEDLPAFVTAADPATVEAYLAEVVRRVARIVAAYRSPRPERSSAPQRTPAEARAAQRARAREIEEATARAFLAGYLADAEPGERVTAADLYEEARETFEDWEDCPLDEDDLDSPIMRAPGPRVFYEVADDVLGARTRSHGIRFYTIPDPAQQEDSMNVTEAILDRVVDKLADRYDQEIRQRLASGDKLGALTLQREHLAATGTDGAPVDLSVERARRRP